MNEEKSIFSLEVNENGAETFRRIYRITRIFFWIALAGEVFILLYTFRNYWRYRNMSREEDPGYYWFLRLDIIYVITYSALFFLQLFYLLKFTGMSKRSLEINDRHLFNSSFKWMHNSFIIAIILSFITVVYFIYLLIS